MSDAPECPHCSRKHDGRCPIVKAIEYFANGKVKRVEYVTAADFPPIAPSGVRVGPAYPVYPQTAPWTSPTSISVSACNARHTQFSNAH